MRVVCECFGENNRGEDTEPCKNEFDVSLSKIKTRTQIVEEEVYVPVESEAYRSRSAMSRSTMMLDIMYDYIPTGVYERIQKTEKYVICPICKNYIVIHETEKVLSKKKATGWRVSK